MVAAQRPLFGVLESAADTSAAGYFDEGSETFVSFEGDATWSVIRVEWEITRHNCKPSVDAHPVRRRNPKQRTNVFRASAVGRLCLRGVPFLKYDAAPWNGAEFVSFVQAICRFFEQLARAFAGHFSASHGEGTDQ